MPDKTVYSLTEKRKKELMETLRQSILCFDYYTLMALKTNLTLWIMIFP